MHRLFLGYFVFLIFFNDCLKSQTGNIKAKELKSVNYPYLLYLPDDYVKDTIYKWPLIIYLHGRSACGNDLSKVRRYGMPFFLDRDLRVAAIAVAPQCPEGKNWVSDNWFTPFLNEMKSKYRVDENRVYLTGMSLGGFGTFSLAIKHPELFAAVAPLCGGGQPATVCPMKDIPIWVFHGDKDKQVPVERSTEMVEALKKCGAKPKYSILKGMPHDIHKTYGNTELYEWFLLNVKEKRTVQEADFQVADGTKVKKLKNEARKPVIKLFSSKKSKPNRKESVKPKKSEDVEYEKINVEFN